MIFPRDSVYAISARVASLVGPLLLEVEVVAPVKFFGLFPDECRRYAEAIAARLG